MRSVAAHSASSTTSSTSGRSTSRRRSTMSSRFAARALAARMRNGLLTAAAAQSSSASISISTTRVPILAPAASFSRLRSFGASRRPLAAASAAASSSDAAAAVSAAATTQESSPSTSTTQTQTSSSQTPPPTQQPPSKAYPFSEIEAKWQRVWDQHQTFRTPDLPGELDTSRPKAYVLDMFPYPSGAGLHVGHPEGYTATDIVARAARMRGRNVLHPIGWDAFGLPAEQYAIQTGTHPAVTTEKNVDRFRQQLKALGFSYDWAREVSTTDPAYYKWTQWIFLKLFERGLAYQATVPVNWCPALGTVLANEEVVGGVSERGGHPVVRLPMKQWMLRITAYADRLLEGLDGLEWDENIKDMQRNWIGRSEGCDVVFGLVGGEGSEFASEASSSSSTSSSTATPASLTAFTTRADTLFGVTYVVLAPEHPLALKLATPEKRAAVEAYVRAAASKSDLERTAEKSGAAARSGVDTGSSAVHPVTGERVPVWVADYVLGSYGTGAVMAVPAHDSRDADFARTHSLPTVEVVVAATKEEEKQEEEDSERPDSSSSSPSVFTSDGVCVSSSGHGLDLDGLSSADARAKVGAFLSEKGRGSPRVSYKLRDWLFARQRYWGEPFPIAYAAEDDEGKDVPLAIDEADLPLVLPPTDDFSPNGTPDPPLAALTEWVNFVDPKTGKKLVRETSTMPQWAGSCWYYIRYLQPWNDERLVDRAAADYWLPVDLYVGGAEHAVLHLLYARFWHKVLFDLGVVPTDEPFRRLVSQGMILGEVEYTARQDAGGNWCNEDDDETSSSSSTAVRIDPSEAVKSASSPTGLALASDPAVHVSARAHKMSKSRGNVVNPDDVVAEFGADSLRLYEMFMGPLRETKVWSTRSVDGVHRFLARSWRLTVQQESSDAVETTKEQLRLLHQTIRRVTDETDALRFNTAISAMMEFVNGATKWEQPRPRAPLRTFALLLAPYAPHLAEEAWEHLGGESFAALAPKERYEQEGAAAGVSSASASSSSSSSSSSSAPYSTLAYAPWPVADESLLVSDSVTLPVQVNGKLRGSVELPAEGDGAGEAAATAAARAVPAVARLLGEEGATVAKVVFVPGRIINFIVVGKGGGGGGKKKKNEKEKKKEA